jgi:hypothetical protein
MALFLYPVTHLQVIKGPVTKHLPAECVRMGLSWSAEKQVRLPVFHMGAAGVHRRSVLAHLSKPLEASNI